MGRPWLSMTFAMVSLKNKVTGAGVKPTVWPTGHTTVVLRLLPKLHRSVAARDGFEARNGSPPAPHCMGPETQLAGTSTFSPPMVGTRVLTLSATTSNPLWRSNVTRVASSTPPMEKEGVRITSMNPAALKVIPGAVMTAPAEGVLGLMCSWTRLWSGTNSTPWQVKSRYLISGLISSYFRHSFTSWDPTYCHRTASTRDEGTTMRASQPA
mmetsp:Transcript_14547/g.25831  ORF Transcript_14547/g.25831 Transcript_14547/m.25831 type:complete len:211 (-) Transcript_14547:1006-1638(-)